MASEGVEQESASRDIARGVPGSADADWFERRIAHFKQASRAVRIAYLAVLLAAVVGSVTSIFWEWPNRPRWPATGWLGLALVPVFFGGVYLSLLVEAKVRNRRGRADG